MAILIDENSRILVQGITGREGSFHTQQMKAFGTDVVAGVTPGKGGTQADGTPIFNTVREAVEDTHADVSAIFVPLAGAADAIMEAADAGVPLIVAITENIPVHDAARAYRFVSECGSRLVGPNCPGLVSSGKAKVGIMPNQLFKEGHVGIISRSGTLTYEMVDELTRRGIGQSTTIGIGGDPVIGTSFTDTLRLFDADPETHVMVLIGEIGGSDEEAAAQYIGARRGKPVVSFISGRTAPPGKRMGHAGAIITGGVGGPQHKVDAFEAVGVPVANTIGEIGDAVEQLLAAGAAR
ncbi:MAG: succinate--CoA ligase subunit alpha [Chloroflexota bacterium]|nr:MAG: succinate--CoA ligase subunit alpha [Chloroflexota bacterium]